MKEKYIVVGIFTIAVSILIISLFSKCVKEYKKNVTVIGVNGTKYESYQECCAAQDFQAAHQFIAKMEQAGQLTYSAKDFVFKQEALYLMSIGDDASKRRLIYLLKEEGVNNSDVALLIDLAIENDDEEFVKRLANQLDRHVEKDVLKRIVEYLSRNDMNKNSEYLSSLLNTLEATDLLLHYAINVGNVELIKQIGPKSINFKNFDLIEKLASMNDKSLSDVIVKALMQKPIYGRPMSKGLHDFYDGDRQNEYESAILKNSVSESHFTYTDGVVDYNKCCDRVLDIAIEAGNQYLAQKVLLCFKQNIETMTGRSSGVKAPDGTKVDGNHSYVYYTNADKNEAQKKYQEAVRSGAFK